VISMLIDRGHRQRTGRREERDAVHVEGSGAEPVGGQRCAGMTVASAKIPPPFREGYPPPRPPRSHVQRTVAVEPEGVADRSETWAGMSEGDVTTVSAKCISILFVLVSPRKTTPRYCQLFIDLSCDAVFGFL